MTHPVKIPMPPNTPVKRRYSVTSKELPKVKVVKKVSEGSFYRIYETEAGTALRVSKRRGDGSSEVAVLKVVDSVFVNRMLRHWEEDGFMHFEMEYCFGGNLEEWLRRRKYLRPRRVERQEPLREERAKCINGHPVLADPFLCTEGSVEGTDPLEDSEVTDVSFEPVAIRHPRWRVDLMRQLAEALRHIHSLGVVHMDLKPANILVRDDRFILCDFNIARFGEGEVDLDGDPVYLAPEILRNRCYFTSDVYSLGLLYLLISNPSRVLPSGGEEYSALRRNDFRGWRVDEIGRSMLERDPRKRCSAESVFTHFEKLWREKYG